MRDETNQGNNYYKLNSQKPTQTHDNKTRNAIEC